MPPRTFYGYVGGAIYVARRAERESAEHRTDPIATADSINTVTRAAAGGIVVWAGCDNDTGNCGIDGSEGASGCGWLVEIRHAGQIGTHYCHMVRRPDVTDGQHVNAGDPIGVVGTSGHTSGPHLHFEVHTASPAAPPDAN